MSKRIRPPKQLTVPAVVVDEVPSGPLGKYGEVFSLYDADGGTPVSGLSYYIFLEQTKNKITMLHPFSLTKFTISTSAFLVARSNNDWNPAAAQLVELLERKIKLEKQLKRDVPNHLTKLLTHYAKLAETSINV